MRPLRLAHIGCRVGQLHDKMAVGSYERTHHYISRTLCSTHRSIDTPISVSRPCFPCLAHTAESSSPSSQNKRQFARSVGPVVVMARAQWRSSFLLYQQILSFSFFLCRNYRHLREKIVYGVCTFALGSLLGPMRKKSEVVDMWLKRYWHDASTYVGRVP